MERCAYGTKVVKSCGEICGTFLFHYLNRASHCAYHCGMPSNQRFNFKECQFSMWGNGKRAEVRDVMGNKCVCVIRTVDICNRCKCVHVAAVEVLCNVPIDVASVHLYLLHLHVKMEIWLDFVCGESERVGGLHV